MTLQEIVEKILEISGFDLPCWVQENVSNINNLEAITPELLLITLLTLSILILLKDFFGIEIGSITTTILSMLGIDFEPGSMSIERGLNVLPYICAYFYMASNNFSLGLYPFDEILNLDMLASLPDRLPNSISFINNFIVHYINIIGLGSLSDYIGIIEEVLRNVYNTIVDSISDNPNRLQLLDHPHAYLFIATALVAIIGIYMNYNIISLYIFYYPITIILEYISSLL